MYQVLGEGFLHIDDQRWRYEMRIRDTISGTEDYGGVTVTTHWANGHFTDPKAQDAIRHIRRELGETIHRQIRGLPYSPVLELEINGRQSDAEFVKELVADARH